MSIIFTIVGILAGLIALLLIIALFVKSDYKVERSISINKSVSAVYDYIKYVKNQDNYSKWNMMDPSMKKDYAGIDGTVGFKYFWDSQNKDAGKGEQEITALTPNKNIKTLIHFIRPFEGLANAEMETEANGENETLVKWGFESKMKYPMNAMLLFMNMEKLIGRDLEIGLNNLKVLLEK